jgi:hypothetical protein
MTVPTPEHRIDDETCHCGRPIHVYDDGFTRGLCEDCSTYRCDTWDGSCGPISSQVSALLEGATDRAEKPVVVDTPESLRRLLDDIQSTEENR